MHGRLSEKHGLGASCYKNREARWYSIGNETSVYQNNIKFKKCNYSWSKSLELIKSQPKKFSFFKNYDLVYN